MTNPACSAYHNITKSLSIALAKMQLNPHDFSYAERRRAGNDPASAGLENSVETSPTSVRRFAIHERDAVQLSYSRNLQKDRKNKRFHFSCLIVMFQLAPDFWWQCPTQCRLMGHDS